MCKRSDSKWSIVGIILHEKSRHFIHFVIGTYSSKDEADEALLTDDIIELADQYGRYSYRVVTSLLNNEGWYVTHRRVDGSVDGKG